MSGAFLWGLLAASSLIIGGAVAVSVRVGLRTIGLVMGFGAGVLISAVAFDLVGEAVGMATGHGWAIAGIFAGCAVFYLGDLLIDRAARSGRARRARAADALRRRGGRCGLPRRGRCPCLRRAGTAAR